MIPTTSAIATDPMQVMSAENAIPASMGGGIASIGSVLSPVGVGVGIAGALVGGFGRFMGAREQAKSQIAQIDSNISALMEEKAYNTQNYRQFIADQLARNKISFYSSGLDYKSGTARSVIESNRRASTEDMNMMIRNYDTQIKNLKTQRAEAEKAKKYAWTSIF